VTTAGVTAGDLLLVCQPLGLLYCEEGELHAPAG
jgi:hypothetical protein